MKKEYMNPEIEVIKIQSKVQLMAGSIGDPEDGPGSGGDGGAGDAEGHYDDYDW